MKSEIIIPEPILAAWRHEVIKGTPRSNKSFKVALKLNGPRLRQLWRAYTQDRPNLGAIPLTSRAWTVPYLLGFHLSNFARVYTLPTRTFATRYKFKTDFKHLHIHDLGCGTGAGAQALSQWGIEAFPAAKQTLELYERSSHLLNVAKSFLAPREQRQTKALCALLDDPRITNILLRDSDETTVKLVNLSYVLNEIPFKSKTRYRLLANLKKLAAAPTPCLLFLSEPAAEASAKNMLEQREGFLEQGWQALYPCPHLTQRCPMYESGKDWCYSETLLKKPAELIEIDKLLGVSRLKMGMSGYVLANEAATKHVENLTSIKKVVVGLPRERAGQSSILLCTDNGLEKKQDSRAILRGLIY